MSEIVSFPELFNKVTFTKVVRMKRKGLNMRMIVCTAAVVGELRDVGSMDSNKADVSGLLHAVLGYTYDVRTDQDVRQLEIDGC